MLCVPRSSTASPIEDQAYATAPSNSFLSSSAKTRFFGGGRKEAPSLMPASQRPLHPMTVSVTRPASEASSSASPTSPSWSMVSFADASPESSSSATSTSTIGRSSGKWLSIVRNTTIKGKRSEPSMAEVLAMDVTKSASTASGSKPLVAIGGPSWTAARKLAEGKARLGIHWRSRDNNKTKSSKSKRALQTSRPTPSPLPVSTTTDTLSDDEDESDASSWTEADIPVASLEAPPPAAFYPPSPQPSPVAIDSIRRPVHSRSHQNLLQLTSTSMQVKQSPHPLIIPRSNSSQATPPLYPRSCNPATSLPRPHSVLVTLHKSRVIQRLLEVPGNLTASEELSIMPFTTRHAGNRTDRNSSGSNSIYPSQFQLSRYSSSSRLSLTRSLMLEDGDPLREPDRTAPGNGRGCSSWSRGLKQWMQRPTFEQRVVMWIPRSNGQQRGDEIGAVRTAVYRPPSKGQTPIVYSLALEALAGIVRERKAGPRDVVRSVKQTSAQLQHPRPTIAARYASVAEGLAQLHIPLAPQPSSSPSTSGSTDTGPPTPHSNNNSSQNLPVFAPPLLREGKILDITTSDTEDDLPLGLVVKRRGDLSREPSDETVVHPRTEKALRAKEKAREEERRKAKEEESKRVFREEVLAARIRRESHRAGKVQHHESEGDKTVATKKAQHQQKPSQSISIRSRAGSESSRSLRSFMTGSTSNANTRPPSLAAPDMPWATANQFGQMSPGISMVNPGIMMPPALVPYAMPEYPFGASATMPNMSMYNASPMFFPHPPPMPITTSRSSSPGQSVGSSSRRSSKYSEGGFGVVTASQNLPSLPSRSMTPQSANLKDQTASTNRRNSSLLRPFDEVKHRRTPSDISQDRQPSAWKAAMFKSPFQHGVIPRSRSHIS